MALWIVEAQGKNKRFHMRKCAYVGICRNGLRALKRALATPAGTQAFRTSISRRRRRVLPLRTLACEHGFSTGFSSLTAVTQRSTRERCRPFGRPLFINQRRAANSAAHLTLKSKLVRAVLYTRRT